jgi:hypothetical protein
VLLPPGVDHVLRILKYHPGRTGWPGYFFEGLGRIGRRQAEEEDPEPSDSSSRKTRRSSLPVGE